MNGAWVIGITAVSTLVTAVGGGSIVTTLARRRPTRVEAVVNLNESTYEWAQRIEGNRQAERAAFDEDRTQFRRDIAEARREAREARAENAAANETAHTLRAELHQAQSDLRACSAEVAKLRTVTTQMLRVIAAIHEPEMTMDRLRVIVADGPVL